MSLEFWHRQFITSFVISMSYRAWHIFINYALKMNFNNWIRKLSMNTNQRNLTKKMNMNQLENLMVFKHQHYITTLKKSHKHFSLPSSKWLVLLIFDEKPLKKEKHKNRKIIYLKANPCNEDKHKHSQWSGKSMVN